MRRAACLTLLVIATSARADDWWGTDKALHFSVSAGLAVGFGLGAHGLFRQGTPVEVALASGLTLAVGAAKELLDLAGLGEPSWKDFAWDAIGCVVGALIFVMVHQAFGTTW